MVFLHGGCLFLVEGLPVLVAAVITWFFMPDSPEKARFLTKEELVITRARAVRQVGKKEAMKVHRISWTEVWGAVCDLKVCVFRKIGGLTKD